MTQLLSECQQFQVIITPALPAFGLRLRPQLSPLSCLFNWFYCSSHALFFFVSHFLYRTFSLRINGFTISHGPWLTVRQRLEATSSSYLFLVCHVLELSSLGLSHPKFYLQIIKTRKTFLELKVTKVEQNWASPEGFQTPVRLILLS